MTGTGSAGINAMAKLKYFIGETHMKKWGLIVFFMLLIPAAALAQEKELYDISQDMFALVETYTACAARDSACTEDDARALQADTENSLRDLALLIKSGGFQSMQLTEDQARLLSERANLVRVQIAHIELFDALCNSAIRFLQGVLGVMNYVLTLISWCFYPGGGGVLGLALRMALASGLGVVFLMVAALVPVAFVLMAPCLFWWL